MRESKITVGTSSVIGKRERQQDSIFGEFKNGRGIGIVCDGMGGLKGGEAASAAAVKELAEAYFNSIPIAHIPSFLEEEGYRIDELIFGLKDERGDPLGGGTTMVAAVVEEDMLYFLSIGDSRIFLLRGGQIMPLNDLHNYRLAMDSMLRGGDMTRQEYQSVERGKADSLISYLGMGNLSLMDIRSLPLRPKDVILLCSDGLYRSMSEDAIMDVLDFYMFDMQQAAEKLTEQIMKNEKKKQDNASVVLIRYEEIISSGRKTT